MNEHAPAPSYKRHRFPPAIIGHAFLLYVRFALRYRDVEELLAERRVILTYETVRQWCRKFGQQYAIALRRRRPRTGDKWLSWPFTPSVAKSWRANASSARKSGRMSEPARTGACRSAGRVSSPSPGR